MSTVLSISYIRSLNHKFHHSPYPCLLVESERWFFIQNIVSWQPENFTSSITNDEWACHARLTRRLEKRNRPEPRTAIAEEKTWADFLIWIIIKQSFTATISCFGLKIYHPNPSGILFSRITYASCSRSQPGAILRPAPPRELPDHADGWEFLCIPGKYIFSNCFLFYFDQSN